MATGKAAQIADALLAHAGNMSIGSPAMPISLPAVSFDRGGAEQYLQVDYFPNRPLWEGMSDGVVDQGLLQVKVVFVGEGVPGVIKPLQFVEQVRAHFAKGLVLFSGATRVKINAEPWVSQSVVEPDRISYPVIISWAA